MKLWILSAMVSKQTMNGDHSFSMVQGYRTTDTEDEARGSFVASVFNLKPGYSIDMVLVSEIPRDQFPPESDNAVRD